MERAPTGDPPPLEQAASDPPGGPVREPECDLDGRARDAPGAAGLGPWVVYHFPDHAACAAFVTRWQWDLELRLH